MAELEAQLDLAEERLGLAPPLSEPTGIVVALLGQIRRLLGMLVPGFSRGHWLHFLGISLDDLIGLRRSINDYMESDHPDGEDRFVFEDF